MFITPKLLSIIIPIAIAVALILWLVLSYNRLVTLRNRVDNAWSQVAVQLQRRLDLVDNIVETVKGYSEHESQTLEKVVQARNAARAAGPRPEVGLAQDPEQMARALRGIMPEVNVLAEAYPQLQANANYLELQRELSQTENKVSYMRQSVNDVTMFYNTAIQKFPTSIVASLFGFKQRQLFEADPAAATVPRVDF